MAESIFRTAFVALLIGAVATPAFAEKISADRRNSEIRYYEFGTCIAKKREVREAVVAFRAGTRDRGDSIEFDSEGFGDCLSAGTVIMTLNYQRLNYVITPNLYRAEYANSPPSGEMDFSEDIKQTPWPCVTKEAPLDVHEVLVTRIRSKTDDAAWDRLATVYTKCGDGRSVDTIFDRERLRNVLARGIFYARLRQDRLASK
jgi:hypothetical protein